MITLKVYTKFCKRIIELPKVLFEFVIFFMRLPSPSPWLFSPWQRNVNPTEYWQRTIKNYKLLLTVHPWLVLILFQEDVVRRGFVGIDCVPWKTLSFIVLSPWHFAPKDRANPREWDWMIGNKATSQIMCDSGFLSALQTF